MGEAVAAVFLLMFIFGLLTFLVMVGVSFFIPTVDGKIAIGLLTFASAGATGFAATWRFMVLAQERELEHEVPEGFTGARTGEEQDFFDRHGYWPMVSDKERPGRWRR